MHPPAPRVPDHQQGKEPTSRAGHAWGLRLSKVVGPMADSPRPVNKPRDEVLLCAASPMDSFLGPW